MTERNATRRNGADQAEGREPEAVTLTPDEEVCSLGAMSVEAAAEFTHICRSDLYVAMDSGKLPFLKIGKSRKIPRLPLIRFLAEHVASAGTAASQVGMPRRSGRRRTAAAT